MTPSPWKPIESAPIGVWVWTLCKGDVGPRAFNFGDADALARWTKSDALTHWMEPIPLPVEDGFEEWWAERQEDPDPPTKHWSVNILGQRIQKDLAKLIWLGGFEHGQESRK